MKKIILISILLLSSLANAQINIEKEWAYEHPLATQILQRLNKEYYRNIQALRTGAITKDQAEHTEYKIKEAENKLQEFVSNRNGNDITDDQNIYMNGQCNLIYNETRQYLSDDQPDWDDKD